MDWAHTCTYFSLSVHSAWVHVFMKPCFHENIFHVLCLGHFLTIIFLSHYVVECGRPVLLQARESAGTTEESTWGVPRKLQWSACFYEPSLIWGCHAACVSRISIKGASNPSWCYQCLHEVVAFYCSEVVAVQTCNTLNGRLMWGHHAAIGLLNILYWCHYERVDCGSVLKLTSILFV